MEHHGVMADARVVPRADLVSALTFSVLAKLRPEFGYEHLVALFKDKEYLVPPSPALMAILPRAALPWDCNYEKEIMDCDDLATCFLAQVARLAVELGLEHPLAIGGITYWSKTLRNKDGSPGFHRATWCAFLAPVEDKHVEFAVLQPFAENEEPMLAPFEQEIEEVQYFDA